MKQILVKSNVEIRRGAETVEELENGVRTLREFRTNR
jgi:hypothetical protein